MTRTRYWVLRNRDEVARVRPPLQRRRTEKRDWGSVPADWSMRRDQGGQGRLHAGRRGAVRPLLSPRPAEATAERVEQAAARMSRELSYRSIRRLRRSLATKRTSPGSSTRHSTTLRLCGLGALVVRLPWLDSTSKACRRAKTRCIAHPKGLCPDEGGNAPPSSGALTRNALVKKFKRSVRTTDKESRNREQWSLPLIDRGRPHSHLSAELLRKRVLGNSQGIRVGRGYLALTHLGVPAVATYFANAPP